MVHVADRAAAPAGQEAAQQALPLAQGERAQVVPLEPEQVEGEERRAQAAARRPGDLPGPAQHEPLLHPLEVGPPTLVHHHQLAVEDQVARERPERGRDLGERGRGLGAAAVAKPGPAGLVPGQQTEAVVLQLEDPTLAAERPAHGGQHELDVAGAQRPLRGAEASELARERGADPGHDGNLSVLSCAVPGPALARTRVPLGRAFLVLLLTASVARLSASPSGAPARVDSALFQDLRWRMIGPFRGGRVLAVAGVPGEPAHFYFGSVNGGVWETTDAGRTWSPIFDGQPIASIGAIALAPSDPKVIYVGTGEADMRNDIAQGDGVYRSGDGGRTWTKIGLADTQQIGRILVHPRDPNVVLVAALGHPYGPNAERGVFRTTDAGKTWAKVLYKDPDTGAIDLAFRPGEPDVVYAALWQTRRPPWNVYPPSNGPGGGLFKSTDGGRTWRDTAGPGFPAKPGRIGVAVSARRPDRVYAMVDAGKGGLYRSDDGGATWSQTSDDKRIWGRGWYFGGVAVEPRDPDVVYACNTALYRSTDAGRTFVPVKGAPGGDDYHELWIDPDRPERRILGTDQGAVVSLNGGATWSSWYNQPTGQMYHVIADDRFPYHVYGAQQDSGAAEVPSRTSVRDGINMTHFREVTAGGENDYIAPDPRDPDRVFGGRVEKLDLQTGQTRSVDPTLLFRDVQRGDWTLPLVFSRRDPRVLYFARERLFRTEDGGRHWTLISPDLTRDEPGVPPNLDPATAADVAEQGRRGVIYTIAPSPLAARDLWVGTDDGRIWRTRDEGGRWTEVTPKALTAWSKVGLLEASRFDADTAYAAVDRHRLDDSRPYIYRTRDGGATWTAAARGIPDGSFVNAVREDPVRRGLLYAATEKGVYVSFDDGEGWQSLQLNLPVTSVRDIDVHGDDVVIGTHGRAFWILDGVTPLRQIDADVARAGAWLFAPATAFRLRPAGFTGTPLPRDEPMADNPQAGAYIDYLVGGAVTGPLTLTILDGRGELVRRYRSDERPPGPDVSRIRVAPEWEPAPAVPSAAPGMHRFVWPLRYPAPVTLGERGAIPEGVWAPPGRYTVELSVGAERRSQPLVVAPDPRVTATPDDYARQFALARAIEDARGRAAAAVSDADALRKSLSDPASSAREHEVSVLLGPEWGAAPSGTPPAGLLTLRGLAETLGRFAEAVDGADGPPAPDVEKGFADLQPALDASLAAWQTLKTKTLRPGP